MSPLDDDHRRAQWLLSDVDPWRVPDDSKGEKVRLIGELYAYRTKSTGEASKYLHKTRFVVGWYDESGKFYEYKRLTRQECREFVRTWGIGKSR